MWFRRKKKPDQDSVLNETLRSLQGILDERESDQMQQPDERREPSLHPDATPEAPSVGGDATPGSDTTPAAPPRPKEEETSPETTWTNLSLSFDVEPRDRPEPESPAGKNRESAPPIESPAHAAPEDNESEISEAAEGTTSYGESASGDDDIEIVIEKPAPAYTSDSAREKSAIKYGSSTLEITLDIDTEEEEVAESGSPGLPGDDIEPAESGDSAGEGVAPSDEDETVIDVARSEPARETEPEDEGGAATGVPADRYAEDVEPGGQAANADGDLADTQTLGLDITDPAAATSQETAASTTPTDTAADDLDAGDETVTMSTVPANLDGSIPAPTDQGTGTDGTRADSSVDHFAATEEGPGEDHAAIAMQDAGQPVVAEADHGSPAIVTESTSDDADMSAAPVTEDITGDGGPSRDSTDDISTAPPDDVPPTPSREEQEASAADAIAAVAEAIRDAEALRQQASATVVDAAEPVADGDIDNGTGAAAPSTTDTPEADTSFSSPTAAIDTIMKDSDTDTGPAAPGDQELAVGSLDAPLSTADVDDSIPLLDDVVYVPPGDGGTADQSGVEPPPPEIRAGPEPAPPDNPPEHTQDPALRPLINRILQNLNLRLELGGGTPISEEQESELRDALFDTLSQWKDRDGTP